MIKNTSIGKQMYKQKKEHGQGLVGLVFHYMPDDQFLALQQIRLVSQFFEFPTHLVKRAWIRDVIVSTSVTIVKMFCWGGLSWKVLGHFSLLMPSRAALIPSVAAAGLSRCVSRCVLVWQQTRAGARDKVKQYEALSISMNGWTVTTVQTWSQ